VNSGDVHNGVTFSLRAFRELHPILLWGIFTLLVLIGILRIVSTYPILSQVLDEPASVACGMEWLDKGTYTYEPMHPPLARVMAAVGPYLKGARSLGRSSVWREGNAILHHKGNYWTNLSLARAGILPFFILGSLIVFLWARELFGAVGALISTVFFTTLPPVLAHAGFATLDMAQAATVLLALYLYNRMLKDPSLWKALFFGSACGIAVLTKFTAGIFLVMAIMAHILTGALLKLGTGREEATDYHPRSPLLIVVIILTSLLTLWSGYRFSYGPVVENSQRPFTTMAGTIRISPTSEKGKADFAEDLFFLESNNLPVPEFFQGVRHAGLRGRFENFSYLLGRIKKGGWWYYYPVALLFKTPLPVLLFSFLGAIAIFMDRIRRRTTAWLMMLIYPAAILLALLPSQVNNGVRQVLPVYGFLSLLGAIGVLALLTSGVGLRIRQVIVTLLLAWYFASGIFVHPDYLAYFNELAGKRPENVLVSFDLDMGQDLGRLVRIVEEMGIKEIYLDITTTAELNRFPLPQLHNLEPMKPVSGWVAVSLWRIKFYNTERYSHPPLGWLGKYTPLRRIGRSILLYHVQEGK
jgi:hypothetical protein